MNLPLSKLKLILYLTQGVSLRRWDEVGLLERELRLYRAIRPALRGVKLVTYGDRREFRYRDRLDGIEIACNRFSLPEVAYKSYIAHLLPYLWRGEVIFKSNQMLGAEVALKAARATGRKFIARCGYLHSTFEACMHGADSPAARRAVDLESKIFPQADRVVVTTELMQGEVHSNYRVPLERIVVIPNYVDIDLFRPSAGGESGARGICFVGRLIKQKNLHALLEAIGRLNVKLTIVGDGPLRDELHAKAREESLRVEFIQRVPYELLPGVLARHALFVLPSLYEGHPKVLIEAMACGLPVIGTDVPGIREIIRHEENGYLCGTSAEELGEAMLTVSNDGELARRMGASARADVVRKFSLDRVAQLELELLERVLVL